MNINYSIIIKSKHWPRRLSRIKKIISKIFHNNKILYFDYNFNYYCNIVLINDFLMRKFNRLYRKKNKTTDVLTFISKLKKNRKNIFATNHTDELRKEYSFFLC